MDYKSKPEKLVKNTLEWRSLGPFEKVILAITFFTLLSIIAIIFRSGFTKVLPIPAVTCFQENPKNTISQIPSIYISSGYQLIPFQAPNPTQMKKKDCYKISDVLSINRAIKMSDSISVVTLLLTFFSIATPLLFYVNLQKEKKSLEENFNGLLKQSVDEKIKNIYPDFSSVISYIESFKTQYLYSLKKEDINDFDSTEYMLEIATNLFRLLSPKEDIKGLLNNIISLLRPELFDKDKHYKMYSHLKYALQSMYEMGIFDTKEKKDALNGFSLEVFKVPLSTLLRYDDVA